MIQEEFSHWQLASRIEEGRNQVLRMVAQNERLENILNTLCKKSLIYNHDMLCSILRLDNEKKTLHPIASVELSNDYCEALDGVSIGAGVGSCGTAAFLKERVIVEDINTHPYWNQYKELALSAGVQACWSEPIYGPKGVIYGTFAMYYRQPRTPTEEDLKFIELSANLAAVVFENNENREKLLAANNQLNKTVNEQNTELKQVNKALIQALKDQGSQHDVKLKAEKMITANNLISGFSHEVSNPVGIALTAISACEDKLLALNNQFTSGQLTRSGFVAKTKEIAETINISKKSLLKTNDLLQRFKDVCSPKSDDATYSFSLVKFCDELSETTNNLLGRHQLDIQCQDIEIISNKTSLWQVLFNLIENSIIHGFEDIEAGIIHINIVKENDEVIINYQDNGCGLTENKTASIFEPFYTSARNKNSIGLGLNITSNLISHSLHGRIQLQKSPVGVRYEIILPLTIQINAQQNLING